MRLGEESRGKLGGEGRNGGKREGEEVREKRNGGRRLLMEKKIIGVNR